MSNVRRRDLRLTEPANATGRNGAFNAAEISVVNYGPGAGMTLAVRSKRPGNIAPIYLELGDDDAIRFLNALREVLL